MSTLTEEWRPVRGYESLYRVSSCGNVQGIERVVVGANGRQIRVAAKTLRARPCRRYLSVILNRDGRARFFYIATLVAEAFIGPRPSGLEVCHGDGDARNNAVVNLRYDTRKANHADKRRHGTMCVGERVGTAKLTASQVVAIRADGRPQRVVAREYGVSKSTIGGIRRGEFWTSV